LDRLAEADADFVQHGAALRRVSLNHAGLNGAGYHLCNGRQLSCEVLDTVTEEVVMTDFPDRLEASREV
jgi:hypothetical protein